MTFQDANHLHQTEGLEELLRRVGDAETYCPGNDNPAPGEDDRPGDAQERFSIPARTWEWRDPRTIPPREWLYDRYLCRGILSITVAPGGVGKSTLSLTEALALATGKSLLQQYQPTTPLRVWSFNLEEPGDELDRKLAGACLHFGIGPDDVGDRLKVNSGFDTPLVTASQLQDGWVIEPVFDALVETIRAQKIDVLIVDPFVSSHDLSENENVPIDRVAKRWSRLANETGIAVSLVHHTRKNNSGQADDTESARGAKALTDAARIVRVLNRMTPGEAELAGIPENERTLYFRTTRDKQNLTPPDKAKSWFHLSSVALDNGVGPLDPGDSIGVVEAWFWPAGQTAGIATADLIRVLEALGDADHGADWRASDWAGYPVAEALGMHPKDDRKRLDKMLGDWAVAGYLTRDTVPYPRKGGVRPVYRVKAFPDVPLSEN